MKLKKIKYGLNDTIKYSHYDDVDKQNETTIEESLITGVQIMINKYGQKNRYILLNGKMIEESSVVRKLPARR